MRFSTSALATAAIVATANAANKGFNYGAFFGNNQAKVLADFQYEFEAAKALPNTNSAFTSARLYTMIQHGTTNTVIEAIQAAINTKTTLLLGLWASAGSANFANEITALKAAISKYGTSFTDLVVGISVGSEDLYRITPTAIQNGETNPGAQPSELIKYISQVRAAIKGTGLASKPVGHVDTWTAYVNGSNAGVIAALDFIGVDAYPYWESTTANSIGNANASFYSAYQKTVTAAKGKPVWVTETGWPVTGPKQNQAVASAANAKIYWQDVSCSLMKNNVNLFYYTLQDVQYSTPSPSFGIKPGGDLKAVSPLFNLACDLPEIPLPSLGRSSSTGIPTSTATSNASTTSSGTVTDLPTSFTISDITVTSFATPTLGATTVPTNPNTPTIATISSPSVPTGLSGPFEAPHLMVPIDRSNPDSVIENCYIAQIDSTHSTLYYFDINSEYAGKTCNLVFYVPPESDAWCRPWHMTTPGGIVISQLSDVATKATVLSNVSNAQPVGAVSLLSPSQGHFVSSAPCAAGQTVGYRGDALGALDLQYFQMTEPPSGLFMTISD